MFEQSKSVNELLNDYVDSFLENYPYNPLYSLDENEFLEFISFYEEMFNLSYLYTGAEVDSLEEKKILIQIKSQIDNFYTAKKDLSNWKAIIFFLTLSVPENYSFAIKYILKIKIFYIYILREYSSRKSNSSDPRELPLITSGSNNIEIGDTRGDPMNPYGNAPLEGSMIGHKPTQIKWI